MKRHEIDVVSLIAGLVFLAVAGTYLVGSAVDYDVDLRWFAPGILIGLGLAGLAGALRSGSSGRATGDGTEGAATTYGQDSAAEGATADGHDAAADDEDTTRL